MSGGSSQKTITFIYLQEDLLYFFRDAWMDNNYALKCERGNIFFPSFGNLYFSILGKLVFHLFVIREKYIYVWKK